VGEQRLPYIQNGTGRGYRLHFCVLFRTQDRAEHFGVVDAGFEEHQTEVLSPFVAITEVKPYLIRVFFEGIREVAASGENHQHSKAGLMNTHQFQSSQS
jgi:hypothetical protein